MKKVNRRRFIQRSVLATASIAALPAHRAARAAQAVSAQASAVARVVGANEDIRFAVVGFNQRGTSHIEGLRRAKGTRLVALCDVDQMVLDRELKKCKEGEKVQGYTAIRNLLENKDIDVVTFATPNHWHALGSIWAIQAGKDVYVEKPVSHNVWEGRQVIAAARQYGRIVQAGTQCRTSTGLREAIAWLHEGHLGKIIRARELYYKHQPNINKINKPQPIPPS